MATLWMGDLEQYMDETFIKQAFTAMGEPTVNVKIISNRMTGTLAGYCFVELADQTAADRCLHKLNGKPLPGSNPPKKFKLNYATYGKKADVGQEYSIFVGDLSPEVDDFHLYDYFVKKYPSCRGGKVVTDTSGNSRGFGFVRFSDEAEQKKALEECQNSKGLGGKPIRISIAVPKRILRSETVQFTNQAVMAAAQVTVNEPSVECGEDGQKVDTLLRFFGYAAGVEGPELSMAFCSDQAEYVETAHNMYWYWQSVKTKPEYQSTATYNYTQYYQQYYSQWGYDPYGSYSYGYPQYSSTETPPVTSSLITEMTQLPEFQQNSIIPDETEEEPVEDPDPKLDIDEVNKQFMEQSEELYDSLMNCHWQPLDTITSEIPTAV